ncbi:MAG: ABC transporter substrate-binding protein [Desulfobacteraceae bacterium]|nr:ABC transporter substrate-binding protein [Desulfobacteraceae bacterium]
MKRSIRSTIVIISLLIVIVGAVRVSIAKEIYSIGVILPMTGEIAAYGEFLKKGIELALDEVNAKNAKKGIIFKAIYEDNKSNPADSINAIRRMIDVHKVGNVIGPLSSRNFVPVMKFAQKHKTVILSLVSSSPEIRNAGEYVFSLYPLDELQGKGLANLTVNRGYKKVAVLYIDNHYGIGVKDMFKKNYFSKGGQIVVEQSMGVDQLTFENILGKIKEQQPDAIIHVSQIRTAALLYTQAKSMGITSKWIAGVEQRSQKLIDQCKGNVEGVTGVLIKIPETDEAKHFSKAFKTKYGIDKVLWSEYGYDAVKLLALAMQDHGDSAEVIQKTLFKASKGYSGASGIKTFDQDGMVGGSFGIWEIRNSKIVELDN